MINNFLFLSSKDPATENELTGANNLMAHFNLEHSYNKFTSKKVCIYSRRFFCLWKK